jgi:hypothetical protein
MIGGNDAHVGVVTQREDNFFGEFANGLPSPERWKTPLIMVNNDPKKEPLVSVWGESAAGLGGVWARETPAKASGTHSSVKKYRQPQVTAPQYVYSLVGTLNLIISNAAIFLKMVMHMASLWVVI